MGYHGSLMDATKMFEGAMQLIPRSTIESKLESLYWVRSPDDQAKDHRSGYGKGSFILQEHPIFDKDGKPVYLSFGLGYWPHHRIDFKHVCDKGYFKITNRFSYDGQWCMENKYSKATEGLELLFSYFTLQEDAIFIGVGRDAPLVGMVLDELGIKIQSDYQPRLRKYAGYPGIDSHLRISPLDKELEDNPSLHLEIFKAPMTDQYLWLRSTIFIYEPASNRLFITPDQGIVGSLMRRWDDFLVHSMYSGVPFYFNMDLDDIDRTEISFYTRIPFSSGNNRVSAAGGYEKASWKLSPEKKGNPVSRALNGFSGSFIDRLSNEGISLSAPNINDLDGEEHMLCEQLCSIIEDIQPWDLDLPQELHDPDVDLF